MSATLSDGTPIDRLSETSRAAMAQTLAEVIPILEAERAQLQRRIDRLRQDLAVCQATTRQPPPAARPSVSRVSA